MKPFRFSRVCIESTAVELPATELTSAEIEDRLAPLYQRLGIPFGTLEKLSGVRSRRLWPRETMPSSMATAAAEAVLKKSALKAEQLGSLINCSVTRDFFEPSTASLVHLRLGLDEACSAFDVSNACIGFSNGILTTAQLIEAGVIDAGLIVSAETVTPLVEACIAQLAQSQDVQRDDLPKLLPTFTLGCGAVAFILCDEKFSTSKHRLVGAVSRTASQFSDLCAGNRDYQLTDFVQANPVMITESAKLMAAAAKLGGRMFKDFSTAFGWTKEDVDHVFCHQVGKQVNDAFYREMGLDIEKEFTVYRDLGNLVSAALPTAFSMGIEQKGMNTGDKVLLTAFGSGLNSIFLGVEW